MTRERTATSWWSTLALALAILGLQGLRVVNACDSPWYLGVKHQSQEKTNNVNGNNYQISAARGKSLKSFTWKSQPEPASRQVAARYLTQPEPQILYSKTSQKIREGNKLDPLENEPKLPYVKKESSNKDDRMAFDYWVIINHCHFLICSPKTNCLFY